MKMREGSHLEVVTAEAEDLRLPLEDMVPEIQVLRSSAAELARNLAWVPGHRESCILRDRCHTLSRRFRPVRAALQSQPDKTVSGDFRLLRQSAFLLQAELDDICATFK